MEQAKSILSRLLQNCPASLLQDLELIRAYWPEAVGPMLARHSNPVKFDAPTLMVEVADARWLEQIVPMRPQIAGFLKQELPKPAVCQIEFVLQDPGKSP